MVKSIKLFENWAEELKVPEYLDPNWIPEKGWNFLKYPDIMNRIYLSDNLTFDNDSKNNKENGSINLRSFSDYDFWNKGGYDRITVYQSHGCIYKLEDLIGLPLKKTGTLRVDLYGNKIKSLIGVKNRKIEEFYITSSKLENLQYAPNSEKFDFEINPLLSFRGINMAKIIRLSETWYLKSILCGSNYSGDLNNLSTTRDTSYFDSFHADRFCKFKNSTTDYSAYDFNPWEQCYYDPNEVGNFDFLFIPFHKASETFRQKANEYLDGANLSGLTRSKEELW